jgi:hypothetical protein
MAKSKGCCKVMVEAPNPQRLHLPTMAAYIQSGLAPWDALDGHMVGAPLRLTLIPLALELRGGFLDGWVRLMLMGHGWGSNPPETASPNHVICIHSVLAPWDAVDGHMGAPLYWYTSWGEGWNLVWLSLSDYVLRLRLGGPAGEFPANNFDPAKISEKSFVQSTTKN